MLLRADRKGEVLLAVTATNALGCLRLRRSILLSRAARQTACRRSPALRLEVDPLALGKLKELRAVAALDVRLRLVNRHLVGLVDLLLLPTRHTTDGRIKATHLVVLLCADRVNELISAVITLELERLGLSGLLRSTAGSAADWIHHLPLGIVGSLGVREEERAWTVLTGQSAARLRSVSGSLSNCNNSSVLLGLLGRLDLGKALLLGNNRGGSGSSSVDLVLKRLDLLLDGSSLLLLLQRLNLLDQGEGHLGFERQRGYCFWGVLYNGR